MRVPDLEDLVTAQERAIRRQDVGADLRDNWRNVLGWLNTLDNDLPIFVSWVDAAFGRYSTFEPQRERMWVELHTNYPKSECVGTFGEESYDNRRLKEVVSHLLVQAGSV